MNNYSKLTRNAKQFTVRKTFRMGMVVLIMFLAAGLARARSPWSNVAGLPAPRYFLAAGVLSNALYAVAGYDGSTVKTNVYCFNGTTWSEVASLPAPRLSLAAGVLSNALYAMGGYYSGTQTNVYRFNGTTWSEVAGLPAPRRDLAAGVLSNALYAVGGDDSGSQTNVYRFNGTTWSEVAGLPAPRSSLAVGMLSNALYAVGGYDGSAKTNVYRFNGTTWSEVAGLPAPRYYLAVGVLSNALYAAGGYSVSAKTNVYRFNGTTWSEVAGLPAPRQGLVAEVLSNALNTVGGYDGSSVKTNVYRYNEELGLRVLGTNAAAIVNGEAASAEKGTDFGAVQLGMIHTNVFSLINTGAAPLVISAVLTNGTGAAVFRMLDVAGQIESDVTSTFSVVFAPVSELTYTAQVSIVNNGAQNPYVLDLAGSAEKYNQTITFTAIADQTFTSTVGLVATASSGLPVSFTVAGGPVSISGQTNLTFTGTGTVSITASQAGGASWNAAPDVIRTFSVTRASQTIIFPAIGDQIVTNTVSLSATASSGLAVSFAVVNGSGLITDGTLSFTGTGIVNIMANQAGNSNWNAASPVTNTFNVTAVQPTEPLKGVINSDFDGDGLSDPAVYDERTGTWSVKFSNGGYTTVTFNALLGGLGWASAAADYDGDGLSDPAVYQETTGNWMILQSRSGYARLDRIAFLGGPGWAVASADYEGDQKADYTVYQEATGSWNVKLSSSGYTKLDLTNFLGGAGYSAIPADYDGDGLADPAVYNRTDGTCNVMLSSDGYTMLVLPRFMGGTGWNPAPADYDGDGKADPAVFQASTGNWSILLSSDSYRRIDLANFLGGL